MRTSEQWLREWINPPISTSELVEQLTLAGLEVDSVQPVAGHFDKVVVGLVLDVAQHPDADRLKVCQVDIGATEPLAIVCGGANVRKNLKVAVATIGATLPNDFKIKKSKLRGVESHGMLCSESELGLAESSAGIMELSSMAPIGQDIRHYLHLDDTIIDIALTPNRGDCLSVLGIAREVAAINNLPLIPVTTPTIVASIDDTIPIDIQSSACNHYVGRIIKNINTDAETPLWMQERLRRSDIRPISTIVDITNYVLLELGQPLHAFDLHHVVNGIKVRMATSQEKITLLDEQTITLDPEDLIIATDKAPIALAGIMGSNDSAISSATTDIFLESALFDAATISKTARKFGIFTDSSHRFERGVDYQLQKIAIQRATQLILDIAGGEAGPLIEQGSPVPEQPSILLRRQRIKTVLGLQLTDEEIVLLLQRLTMQVSPHGNDWRVIPPSYRSDIESEIDLIEEIIRLRGYDSIPDVPLDATLEFLPVSETTLNLVDVKKLLAGRGYQEAITYSFVDPELERALKLQPNPLTLLNPISPALSTMRSNHWPGLLKAYQHNVYRQQPRIKLFEIGLCFDTKGSELKQILRLGGLCAGLNAAEQWGEAKRIVDFYDVKGDIESVLKLATKHTVRFEASEHPALHPGKSAAIVYEGKTIGFLGALHPIIAKELDLQQVVYLFDLELESIMKMSLPSYSPISKFPAIRRDIALVVATDVPAERIREKILDSGGDLLKNVQIFDVYSGKGIESGKKSIAFSLLFQHVSRTLVDTEINDFMQQTIKELHKEFNATLRD